MDLDHYYSDIDIETWKTILGEKMHYHYAVPSHLNDPFDQSVIDLFPYIKPNSKVLDCGCGWGGPGKLIQKELECEVTGITISKSQYEYIKDFEVIHGDLEIFTPDKKYDLAIFMESYTHIHNSSSMLKRFYDNVDSILIKDYLSDCWKYIPEWDMLFRPKNAFIQELKDAGYQVKKYYEIEDIFQPAIDFWENNLMKLDPTCIKGQVKDLFDLCHWYKYERLYHEKPLLKQCVIHATK
jgi:hypothetical protein